MKQLAASSYELSKPCFQRMCVVANWVFNCITHTNIVEENL